MELNSRNNLLFGTSNKSQIADLLDLILSFAKKLSASDIHFEMQAENLRIRFRIDGRLFIMATMPCDIGTYLNSYLKLIASLDITEKRIPQDGSILIKKQNLNLRISTMPVFYGEKIVVRLLGNEQEILPLHKMGFLAENLSLFKNLIHSSSGIIAITGPVNSGKSTLLYSVLDYLNKNDTNIVTIEDPIEMKLAGVNQTQINLKAGMDFATALRAVLRQDPDILMVGEIRDFESAKEVIRASLTGHLVLTTLHTTNAMGVPARLIDMGINPSMLSISLLASTAQRLIRVICPHCREEYLPTSNSLESLVLENRFYQGMKLYRGKGCSHCHGSGYLGRIAIQEIMAVDDNVKSLIARGDIDLKLKRLLQLNGMKMMLDDGIEKILQGITTVQEVWRALNGVCKFN